MKINLREFLRIIGRKLVITATYDDENGEQKWNATIEGDLFIQNGLKGHFDQRKGDYVRASGKTPKGAIANLAHFIRGKTLIERDANDCHPWYCPEELAQERTREPGSTGGKKASKVKELNEEDKVEDG